MKPDDESKAFMPFAHVAWGQPTEFKMAALRLQFYDPYVKRDSFYFTPAHSRN